VTFFKNITAFFEQKVEPTFLQKVETTFSENSCTNIYVENALKNNYVEKMLDLIFFKKHFHQHFMKRMIKISENVPTILRQHFFHSSSSPVEPRARADRRLRGQCEASRWWP
jgi:hypothetical protein